MSKERPRGVTATDLMAELEADRSGWRDGTRLSASAWSGKDS